MAKHSISEAARLSSKSRSTLHRHIKCGKLSKEIGLGGDPVIDTSELRRVYGDLLQPGAAGAQVPEQLASPHHPALEAEYVALRRENEALREERDRWAAQAERLTSLLADQRPPRARATGVIARLFGR